MKNKMIEMGRVTCFALECIHNENPLCLIFTIPYPPQMIEEGGYCCKYKRKEFLKPKNEKKKGEENENL